MNLSPAQIKALSEARFEQEAREFGSGIYIHRLPDTHDIRNKGTRGTPSLERQPADYVVNFRADMFYAEVKGCTSKKLMLSRFEPSQWGAMRSIAAASGAFRYNVMIFDIFEHCWYVVPHSRILRAKDAGDASLSFSTLASEGYWNARWTEFQR